MPSLIPRLHIITDTDGQQRWSHLELAKMAWTAGKCVVQYRNKRFSAEQHQLEAQAIADLAHATDNWLIVNDNVALACDLNAQGIHLGQGDCDPRYAAEWLGPGACIGATVHTHAELEALRDAPIHYIGVGPVFGTQSKATGLPDLGLEGLASICAASPWPVIAIGGIGLTQVDAVMDAGAHGVAVISAFCLAPNPQDVAAAFLARLESR
jgi:thiamine-phosphate pyrophosphorylase